MLDTAPLPAPDVLHRIQAWAEGEGMDLPLLPDVAQRVMAASSRDDAGAKELAEIIRRDPSLATHILRVANSPAYAGRARIVSLQQATSRLGVQVLRNMALTVACQARLFRAKGHEARVRALFRHSLAAGFVAQEIARMKRRNVEEAFLAGLLHDVGRVLVLERVAAFSAEDGRPFPDEVVLDVMDRAHARVGAALVRRWDFPASLADAIEHHHAPGAVDARDALPHLVSLADDVAHALCGSRPVTRAELEAHPSLPEVHFYAEDLAELLDRKQQILSCMEAFS